MNRSDEQIAVRIDVKKSYIQVVFETIVKSIPGMRVQDAKNGRYTDLLIYELGQDIEKDFSYIRGVLNSGEVGEVFLTSENSDPQIMRQAMRAGVKEFFSQPLQDTEISQALHAFKLGRKEVSPREEAKHGQIITVLGSKGGVGTTTIAANLSVAMAEMDRINSVALLDMNKTFGEIPLFLSIAPTFDWSEIVKNIERIDVSYLMNILTKHASGVHVLPSPSKLESIRTITLDPDVIEHLLELMKKMFDYIVIDGGCSLDEVSLKMIEASDSVLLVTSLSLPYLFTTNKYLESLEYFGYPVKNRVKIVINRFIKGGEISLEDAETSLKNKIFWSIPNDYATTTSAINQGKVISKIAPKAAITDSLNRLASLLMYGKETLESGKQEKWAFLRKKVF